jgi:RND superfamily putative drug exporter
MMTTGTPRADGALAGLARFCYRRRRLVLLSWVDNDYSGGDSDSAKAQVLIEKRLPEQQGDTLTLAIKAENGIDNPADRQRIEKVIADLDASPITGPVTSPYLDEDLVTDDRHFARATIPLTNRDVGKAEVKSLVDTVKGASGDGVTLGLGGDKAERPRHPRRVRPRAWACWRQR